MQGRRVPFCVSFALTYSYLPKNENTTMMTQRGTVFLRESFKSLKIILINTVIVLAPLGISLSI